MFSSAERIAVLPPRGEGRAGSSLWSGTAACFLSRLQAPADSGGALACLHPSPGPGPSEAAPGVQPREAADGGGGPGAPLRAKVRAPWALQVRPRLGSLRRAKPCSGLPRPALCSPGLLPAGSTVLPKSLLSATGWPFPLLTTCSSRWPSIAIGFMR